MQNNSFCLCRNAEYPCAGAVKRSREPNVKRPAGWGGAFEFNRLFGIRVALLLTDLWLGASAQPGDIVLVAPQDHRRESNGE